MRVLICLHLPLRISHRRLIITSQYRWCPPGTHDLGLSVHRLEKGRPGVKTIGPRRRRRRRVHIRFMFPVKAGRGRVGSGSRLWSLSPKIPIVFLRTLSPNTSCPRWPLSTLLLVLTATTVLTFSFHLTPLLFSG